MTKLRTFRELPVGSPERECVWMATTTLAPSVFLGIDIDSTLIDADAGRISFRNSAGIVMATAVFDTNYYGGLRAYVIPSPGSHPTAA